ncbi:hypothetical protein DFJ77DRAFT_538541 [Powellomyces hirtus]|nr:hypothetical protein DFJ77DRAFT_538541 [Powellomyces hirtus]
MTITASQTFSRAGVKASRIKRSALPRFCQPPRSLRVYSTASHPDSAEIPRLTFAQRFGTPISTLLLYSSLTLISLQYLWTRLTFEETRINEERRIEALKEELENWKLESERVNAGSLGKVGAVQRETGSSRRWWLW